VAFRFVAAFVIVPCLASSGRAAGAELPARLATLPPGRLVSAIPTLSDPTQTWELYLPKSFTPARTWPVLILFDPRSRGRVAVELFRDAADEFGWILAGSNNVVSDGPGAPNARAINAMIPDVMKRLPVDERRIYAGGFSGGGVLAWTVGLKGGYLAGVISIGGRPAPEHAALIPKFALFAAAGERDFNYRPTIELDAIAARAGAPHRLDVFPGPHGWCPPAVARDAVAWMELQAVRGGRSALPGERIVALLSAELEAARRSEESGDLLAALRRYRTIAETSRGLPAAAEIAAAEKGAAELERTPAVAAARREEKAAEGYERQGFRNLDEALERVRQSRLPVSPRELRQTLGLSEARRRLAAGGIQGSAAARVLAAIQVHLSFYLTRELFAAGEYKRAVPVLEVATEAAPEDSSAWYNLACAQARSGATDAAFSSLAKALDRGLPQPLQLETDADLAPLRGLPEFERLLGRARALAGRDPGR
jgi:dienelactone hydrolase